MPRQIKGVVVNLNRVLLETGAVLETSTAKFKTGEEVFIAYDYTRQKINKITRRNKS